jgi:hypothetical protein
MRFVLGGKAPMEVIPEKLEFRRGEQNKQFQFKRFPHILTTNRYILTHRKLKMQRANEAQM